MQSRTWRLAFDFLDDDDRDIHQQIFGPLKPRGELGGGSMLGFLSRYLDLLGKA